MVLIRVPNLPTLLTEWKSNNLKQCYTKVLGTEISPSHTMFGVLRTLIQPFRDPDTPPMLLRFLSKGTAITYRVLRLQLCRNLCFTSKPNPRLALFNLMLVPSVIELQFRISGQRNLRTVTGRPAAQCPLKLLCLST